MCMAAVKVSFFFWLPTGKRWVPHGAVKVSTASVWEVTKLELQNWDSG